MDPAFWTAVGAVLISVVTGVFGLRKDRGKNRIDMASTVNESLKLLLEENRTLLRELRKQHEDDVQEKAELQNTVDTMKEELGELRDYLAELFAYMRRRGIFEDAPKFRPRVEGSFVGEFPGGDDEPKS